MSGHQYWRDETVYRGQEKSGFHWLGQKLHPSAFNRIASAFFVRHEASEKENWNVAKPRIQRSLARKITASLVWHVDIEQHDVRLELQRSGQSAEGFIDDHHFVFARIFEDHARKPRKVLIVIYNQDPSLAHPLIRSKACAVMGCGNY
jgi:hypothetical protein